MVNDVVDEIESGQIQHLFLLENQPNSDAVNQVIETTQVETYTFRRLDNIKDEERDENIDYFSIMNSNIELLRDELY